LLHDRDVAVVDHIALVQANRGGHHFGDGLQPAADNTGGGRLVVNGKGDGKTGAARDAGSGRRDRPAQLAGRQGQFFGGPHGGEPDIGSGQPAAVFLEILINNCLQLVPIDERALTPDHDRLAALPVDLGHFLPVAQGIDHRNRIQLFCFAWRGRHRHRQLADGLGFLARRSDHRNVAKHDPGSGDGDSRLKIDRELREQRSWPGQCNDAEKEERKFQSVTPCL